MASKREDVTVERVVAAYRRLGSIRAVAEELGTSGKTVHQRLHAAGTPGLVHPEGGRPRFSDAELVAALIVGCGNRGAARWLGVSPTAVRKRRRKMEEVVS